MAELTGKAVSELPEATNLQDSDLLAIGQNANSKKVTVETLKKSFLPNRTNDHIFADVAAIESFFESIVADKSGEYHEFLTIVHTDSNSTVLQPHVRWSGVLVKDTGGNTITFTASCYLGRIAIMTRDQFGEWKIFAINGTQV